jgi:hypothetical protein
LFSDTGSGSGATGAGASGSRILEIVGSALKGLIVLGGRFRSVFGFSSMSETAFLGGGGGVDSGAGTAAAAAAAFPLPPTGGAVIARGGVLLGAGAEEDSAVGLEGVERGGRVAIQSDIRKREGGWAGKRCANCGRPTQGHPQAGKKK